MSAASKKYLDTLRDCLFSRDVPGVTEKAAEAAAAAGVPLGVAVAEITGAVGVPLAVAVAEITGAVGVPLAVAEIPAGASCPPSPLLVVALADTEAEARVAAVAEVVAPIVVAFCRAHDGKEDVR